MYAQEVSSATDGPKAPVPAQASARLAHCAMCMAWNTKYESALRALFYCLFLQNKDVTFGKK
jgi:hypothetical protein